MCSYCGCRSISVIARFTAEHDEIVNGAGELRRAIDAGDHVAAVDAASRLKGLLDPHTGDEERTLFAELAKQAEFTDHVRQLCAEHRDLDEQLAGLRAGDVDAMNRFYDLLREHINKEENGLFPAAAIALDGDAWDRSQALLDSR